MEWIDLSNLDVRSKLTDELKKNGIKLEFESEVESVEKTAEDSFKLKLKKKSTTIDTNLVMFAIGRKPQTEKLGLEKAGVKTDDKGTIKVDDFSQTNVPNIYAVNSLMNSRLNVGIFSVGWRLYGTNGFNSCGDSRRTLFSKYALQ